jgi:hypothetical protein
MGDVDGGPETWPGRIVPAAGLPRTNNRGLGAGPDTKIAHLSGIRNR